MKININKTFVITTPESSEIGDFHSQGYHYFNRGVTFTELVGLLKDHPNASCYPNHGGKDVWYSSEWYVIDYEKLEDEQTSIHLSTDNEPWVESLWRLAAIQAGHRLTF